MTFILDSRLAWTVPAGAFEDVAALVATAYALGLGLPCAPSEAREDGDTGESFARQIERVPAMLKTGSGNRPRITCSVLDRFYCHREVARFEPDWRGGPGRPPREQRRVDTRHAASECAASLNALVAA